MGQCISVVLVFFFIQRARNRQGARPPHFGSQYTFQHVQAQAMRPPRATALLLVLLVLLLASTDAFVVRSSSSLNRPSQSLSGRRGASVPSPLFSTPSGISAEEEVTGKLQKVRSRSNQKPFES